MFCLRLSNITTFHVSMLRHPAKFQFKKTHRPSACSVLLWLCVRFPLSVLDWVCLLSKISFFFFLSSLGLAECQTNFYYFSGVGMDE